jgi:lipoprotein-anchoring transpeptidase ErfK/SrfK
VSALKPVVYGNPNRLRIIDSAKVNRKVQVMEMKQLALALAVTGAFALGLPAFPAHANDSYEARVTASAASRSAHDDMLDTFGTETLKPGKYVWRDDASQVAGDQRVVVSLGDQMAYLYRGDELVAAASVSTGRPGHETPNGVFQILGKETMHHSKKYDDAPMPYVQWITGYGVGLHAGPNPGHAASHGCIRLPSGFAKKLFTVTDVGTPVLIGA